MDIAQVITDRIIEELEKGAAPWVKPWRDVKGRPAHGQPYNPASGTVYRGVNWAYLSLMGEGRSNLWLTFKQAQDLGGTVKKGAKGVPIVFWKPLQVKDKVTGEAGVVPMLKHYFVFNAQDCEEISLPAPKNPLPEITWDACDKAEELAGRLELAGGLHHGGNSAFFRPSTDAIHLPEKAQFASRENYYATLLHESVHATGHDSRLKRLTPARFGSENYAYEELVAELGAAMLCAYCGLDGDLRHADYIGSWLKALKDDKKFIISAAGKAQAAMDFLVKGKVEQAETVEEMPLAA
jgi:antirestriction protein ArdC